MANHLDLHEPAILKHSVLDFRQMSTFVEDPLIFERAEGVHYWDTKGKHYWDGLSGIFVAAVGHRNPRVIQALARQMEKLTFAPPLHGANPPAIEFCARLAELTPGDLNTVKLLSSGSEATETAMKLARQFWKQSGVPTKWKVISRHWGYHGATLGAMAATGTPSRRTPFEPLPAGFVHIPTVHCYRCPHERSYPACNVFCARYLEQIIQMEGPETVSAFIVEPVGNTGGILVPPPEYLPTIRDICDRYDVLLIFDEMITGMGRTGQLFAAQTYGVTPDILCLGKGLSSGYAPLAATIWNDRIQAAFWGPERPDIAFGHGHTFAGNPISATAGLAVLEEVLSRDLLANARAMGAHLGQSLRDMGQRHGIFGEVRGVGLLWGVELARDPATRTPFPPDLRLGKQIGAAAQARGLILRHDPDWFALAPPLIVTRSELDAMLAILDESIAAVLARL